MTRPTRRRRRRRRSPAARGRDHIALRCAAKELRISDNETAPSGAVLYLGAIRSGEHAAQQRLRHVGAHPRGAETIEQNEAHLACHHLLVPPHQREIAVGREPRRIDRQARAPQEGAQALDIVFRNRAEPGRYLSRHHHAGGDGLAVQPLAVADAGLDRMPEGVAKIEERPVARFALVGSHDARP